MGLIPLCDFLLLPLDMIFHPQTTIDYIAQSIHGQMEIVMGGSGMGAVKGINRSTNRKESNLFKFVENRIFKTIFFRKYLQSLLQHLTTPLRPVPHKTYINYQIKVQQSPRIPTKHCSQKKFQLPPIQVMCRPICSFHQRNMSFMPPRLCSVNPIIVNCEEKRSLLI